MADKSYNKALAQKTSAIQWPQRSNKWPQGYQKDKEAIPPSPSATEEDKEEEQPNKPKRKKSVRTKYHGRKPQRIPSPAQAREPERMPPIHKDDFKDIRGYPIEEPLQTTEGVKCYEIPSTREFVSGGKTLEDRV